MLTRLLPLCPQALAPLAAYLEGLAQEQPIAAAEQQILRGKPAEALRSVFLADSAACKAQVGGSFSVSQRHFIREMAL